MGFLVCATVSLLLGSMASSSGVFSLASVVGWWCGMVRLGGLGTACSWCGDTTTEDRTGPVARVTVAIAPAAEERDQ